MWNSALFQFIYLKCQQNLVHRTRFTTRREARAALFEYIEIFLQPPKAPLEHRLPNASTSKDGHHRDNGRIEQSLPGQASASNAKQSWPLAQQHIGFPQKPMIYSVEQRCPQLILMSFSCIRICHSLCQINPNFQNTDQTYIIYQKIPSR